MSLEMSPETARFLEETERRDAKLNSFYEREITSSIDKMESDLAEDAQKRRKKSAKKSRLVALIPSALTGAVTTIISGPGQAFRSLLGGLKMACKNVLMFIFGFVTGLWIIPYYWLDDRSEETTYDIGGTIGSIVFGAAGFFNLIAKTMEFFKKDILFSPYLVGTIIALLITNFLAYAYHLGKKAED